MKTILKTLTLSILGSQLACSPGTDSSKLSEAWDGQNAPGQLRDEFIESGFNTKFDELKTEAKLSKMPWSGDYWATYRGGISYRWNTRGSIEQKSKYDLIEDPSQLTSAQIRRLSPAEKFDLYAGYSNFALTKAERRRTAVLTDDDIATWEGLCHAWAPATVAFETPKPVTLTSLDGEYEIPFGASDVKALLTYFVHSTRSPANYFLGRRCNRNFDELQEQYENGEITLEQLNAYKLGSDCKGVNAGSFHVVIANQIGEKDKSFMIDKTRDYQVWNQPVVSYTTNISETMADGSAYEIYETAAPGTAKIVKVDMVMKYITEIRHYFDSPEYRTPRVDADVPENYSYYLELDADGHIIGGEWLTENRPDFMWKASIPSFAGPFAPIQDIYSASIAAE
ncbi:MAG: hypothetical protein HRU19_15500 [Pseudobacteriovorax sp.]|nr:hypothetical protein [Pseudobacteriovorax sp.]